ncbi:leukocidin family pore-forming toxin [Vibrio atlanticus]|uniref:Hemolysin n=1 Tax=Vibrio atlanticus TaxID=693153 RepID=A0A1C3J2L0_9VIBR|nr:leukocidin family pore-forming toxin [Vibrio atlanticus]SBS67905.1 Hemolysin precursor [Vibrio atlanticus]
MKRLNLIGILVTSVLISRSVLASDTLQEGINIPVGESIHIMSDMVDNSDLVYINAKYWLESGIYSNGIENAIDLIVNNGYRYLVDFSEIEGNKEKIKAKHVFRKVFGISLESDYIAITEHNHNVMFTEIKDRYDTNIPILSKPAPKRQKRSTSNTPAVHSPVPSISRYYNATKQITDSECDITWNTQLGDRSRHLCKNANISLVYKINMQRSLAFGTIGSATPDAKIVRVGIDDSTTGAGISLNPEIYSMYLASRGIVWPSGGIESEWVSSAIAQNYTFEMMASNNKTSILRTIPATNLNVNYDKKEVSTFQFGIGGDVGADKTSPKISLNANASWTESKWLSYKTFDYAVTKSSKSPQHVSFKWSREQYNSPHAIQKDEPPYGVTVRKNYFGRLHLINPIGYANFTPKMEVIYYSEPETTGTTDISISSSVGITGYRYYSEIPSWEVLRYYYPNEKDFKIKNVKKDIKFTVDWDNPVFIGGKPVNLQLGKFNNKCVSVNENLSVNSDTCNISELKQSFIFDTLNRYQSTSQPGMCLDASNIKKVSPCSLKRTQRWKWIDDKDELENSFTGSSLGYTVNEGEIKLIPKEKKAEDNINSVSMFSSYTDIFNM